MNRKVESNLAVIQNFILHLTHCDNNPEDGYYQDLMRFTPEEMYQSAIDYIKEDHVDGHGEDSERCIDLWLDAEEANRLGDEAKAIKLKNEFHILFNNDWIDKRYVIEYLESVGG